jgi:hypothetical protein
MRSSLLVIAIEKTWTCRGCLRPSGSDGGKYIENLFKKPDNENKLCVGWERFPPPSVCTDRPKVPMTEGNASGYATLARVGPEATLGSLANGGTRTRHGANVRSVAKGPFSRSLWPVLLDSKSGAGQPVEGSNPLPSALKSRKTLHGLAAFRISPWKTRAYCVFCEIVRAVSRYCRELCTGWLKGTAYFG